VRGGDLPDHADGESPWRRAAIRLLAVAALVALDLATKSWVFAWLGAHDSELVYDAHGHKRLELVGKWLAFYKSSNRGMAWGVSLPAWILMGGRVVASLFLVYLVVRTPRSKRTLVVALVLILGGALGNLHDNIFQPRPDGWPLGEVRDFIDVYFSGFDWHFPTFNVADSYITIGAVFLFASGVFSGEKRASVVAAS
jgi:signal peptidase II